MNLRNTDWEHCVFNAETVVAITENTFFKLLLRLLEVKVYVHSRVSTLRRAHLAHRTAINYILNIDP